MSLYVSSSVVTFPSMHCGHLLPGSYLRKHATSQIANPDIPLANHAFLSTKTFVQVYVHTGSVASFASHSLQPLTVAIQAPLSMGFFKQEYWNGLSSPPPGDLPSPGIKPKLPASPALENSLPLSHQRNPLSQVYPTAKILLTKRNF